MAEWAQLRAGTTVRGGLERGFWYSVHLRQADGVVWLLGPGDSSVPMEPKLVRVINWQPKVITRIPETEFQSIRPGEPAAKLRFYGICPKGHFVKDVAQNDVEAQCSKCENTYPVDDEEP